MLPMFWKKLFDNLLWKEFHHGWSICCMIAINILSRSNILLLWLLLEIIWLILIGFQFILQSWNHSFIVTLLKAGPICFFMNRTRILLSPRILYTYPWLILLSMEHFIYFQPDKFITLSVMLHIAGLKILFLFVLDSSIEALSN